MTTQDSERNLMPLIQESESDPDGLVLNNLSVLL